MAKTKTTSLKIGFVLDDSLDTPDGVQQYILTVGKWLSAQGHDVHYLVGQTSRRDIPNLASLSRNVKVRFNRNRMSMPLPVSRKAMEQLLRREDFDVLHIQLPYSPFLAGKIIQAAPHTTAVVGTFHIAPHSKVVHVANHLLRMLTKRSLKRFDDVMSVSSVAQQFAQRTFKLQSEVVPNTVDLAPFMRASPLPEYRNELTVLFLGRLVERKGCQHLLRAVHRMQEHTMVEKPYKVVLCGRGPLEEKLRKYVREHKLEKIVEFAGFIEEADKPRYMASSDIAVFPSTGGESFGIVLLEAMAASRGAILAGDNPGYASVMHEHPEALFKPHDEEHLADVLAHLLNDPTKRKTARDWQLTDVQRYDVPIVGAQIVAHYQAALHKRGR